MIVSVLYARISNFSIDCNLNLNYIKCVRTKGYSENTVGAQERTLHNYIMHRTVPTQGSQLSEQLALPNLGC